MGDASLDPELRYEVCMEAAAGENTTFLDPIAQSIAPFGSEVEIVRPQSCTINSFNMVKASVHRCSWTGLPLDLSHIFINFAVGLFG